MAKAKPKPHRSVFQGYKGRRFGRLKVRGVGPAATDGALCYVCKCRCGNIVVVRAASLRYHVTESCGCLAKQRAADANRTHGGYQRPEYGIWKAIKRRCTNPRSESYHNYGGRGIKLCQRWLNSFANFFADVGERPSPKHTLERRNNNGPYAPYNVYWATRKEQLRNTRRNRIYTYKGQTACLTDLAEKYGINLNTARGRARRGQPIERILEPVKLL